MKKRIFCLLVISFLFFVVGCSSTNKVELESGKYVTQGSDTNNISWVLLQEDNKFEFNRGMVTSYRPTGTYSIKDENLILFVSEKETYEFGIDGDQLVFIRGDFMDSLIEKGTAFKLSSNK